ncbi:DUF6438 domain-containing protein [Flavobacterium orientale]|uniref:DUF6438 domain-containing protein n=1 Tax=Flavobacterium orientale TaxID=1756020 RepID=A0A917DCP0_9FLAO|nr:DUF6438 domain-containing protein [Flavobacterium orientale]GGD27132.1 hypothetical protein GCM10011343_16710 [Flavobacterium orientale]
MKNIKNLNQLRRFGIVCGTFVISLFLSCNSDSSKFNYIEISTSGCYGTCPVIDAKIEKNKIYFNLIEFNKFEKGNYLLNLDRDQIIQINKLYNNLDLETLNTIYSNDIADEQRIKVKFFNKNKIKEIFYIDGSAPKNLEAFVDYIIKLKDHDSIKKKKIQFSFSTRIGFDYAIPAPPPNPHLNDVPEDNVP